MASTFSTTRPMTSSSIQANIEAINGSIEKAIKNSNSFYGSKAIEDIELRIRTGQALLRAFGNLSCTFEKDLKQAQVFFDELNNEVKIFETEDCDLSSILQKTNSTFNSISNPLFKMSFNAKMTSINPLINCLIGNFSPDESFNITIEGNFPYAETTGYTPSLKFKQKECTLVSKKTHQLIFQIPPKVFEFQFDSKYFYTYGQLNVPFNNGYWIWPTAKDCFMPIGLGALPFKAGHITVDFESPAQLNFDIYWERAVFLDNSVKKISKVTYKAFNGKVEELTTPSLCDARLLQGKNENNCWKIWIVPPFKTQSKKESPVMIYIDEHSK